MRVSPQFLPTGTTRIRRADLLGETGLDAGDGDARHLAADTGAGQAHMTVEPSISTSFAIAVVGAQARTQILDRLLDELHLLQGW